MPSRNSSRNLPPAHMPLSQSVLFPQSALYSPTSRISAKSLIISVTPGTEADLLLDQVVPSLGNLPGLFDEPRLGSPLRNGLQPQLIHGGRLPPLSVPDHDVFFDEPQVKELAKQLRVEVVVAVLDPWLSGRQLFREEAQLPLGHRQGRRIFHLGYHQLRSLHRFFPVSEQYSKHV